MRAFDPRSRVPAGDLFKIGSSNSDVAATAATSETNGIPNCLVNDHKLRPERFHTRSGRFSFRLPRLASPILDTRFFQKRASNRNPALLPSKNLGRPCSFAKPRRQPSPAYTPWRSDDARRNRRFLGARLEDSGMKKGGRREKFPAPARLYEGPERLSGILRTVVRAPRPRLRYGSSQGPPVRYPRTPPPRCGRGASDAPFQARTL